MKELSLLVELDPALLEMAEKQNNPPKGRDLIRRRPSILITRAISYENSNFHNLSTH